VRWLSALVTLAPLLIACSTFVPPPVPTERAIEKEPIRTARAQRGDISGALSLSGEIRPKGQHTVTSRVAGRLERLNADLGGAVQQGQPVAELERTSFELRVVQGEAALAAAEARLAGLIGAAKPEDVTQAEAVLRGARARLEALESAPRGDSPEVLLSKLQAARQRVTELEAAAAQFVAQADAAVTAARLRADQLQRDSNAAQNQAALTDARQAQRQAEEAAAQARRSGPSEDLARARQELVNAQDQLLLARNPVSQADLEAARAAVQAAEIGLSRAATPPNENEVKSAEANVKKLQAELEVARLEAREATILAPFTGLVSEVFVAPGALVAPGSPLLTVIPPSFEVVVLLPESQIGQVAVGQPVRLGVEAYPGQEFTGAVRAIAPAIDPRTRSVSLRVEVADPAFRLKTGMFAQLSVASPPKRGALLVPKEALAGRAGESVVIYQVLDGRARRQPVQTGAADGRNVEILAGLSDGAEVVISASAQTDGALVR
jgi:multidrug efflux pump subunit AcrA (membrane-fusion protein)